MTLLAVDPIRISIDPRRYVWCPSPGLSTVCEAPECAERWQLQEHHIVRRSQTAGPLSYITIDGLVVRNTCMLCSDCHDKVTGQLGGHRAAIRRTGVGLTPGKWLWCDPHPRDSSPAFTTKLGVPWYVSGPLKTTDTPDG